MDDVPKNEPSPENSHTNTINTYAQEQLKMFEKQFFKYVASCEAIEKIGSAKLASEKQLKEHKKTLKLMKECIKNIQMIPREQRVGIYERFVNNSVDPNSSKSDSTSIKSVTEEFFKIFGLSPEDTLPHISEPGIKQSDSDKIQGRKPKIRVRSLLELVDPDTNQMDSNSTTTAYEFLKRFKPLPPEKSGKNDLKYGCKPKTKRRKKKLKKPNNFVNKMERNGNPNSTIIPEKHSSADVAVEKSPAIDQNVEESKPSTSETNIKPNGTIVKQYPASQGTGTKPKSRSTELDVVERPRTKKLERARDYYPTFVEMPHSKKLQRVPDYYPAFVEATKHLYVNSLSSEDDDCDNIDLELPLCNNKCNCNTLYTSDTSDISSNSYVGFPKLSSPTLNVDNSLPQFKTPNGRTNLEKIDPNKNKPGAIDNNNYIKVPDFKPKRNIACCDGTIEDNNSQIKTRRMSTPLNSELNLHQTKEEDNKPDKIDPDQNKPADNNNSLALGLTPTVGNYDFVLKKTVYQYKFKNNKLKIKKQTKKTEKINFLPLNVADNNSEIETDSTNLNSNEPKTNRDHCCDVCGVAVSLSRADLGLLKTYVNSNRKKTTIGINTVITGYDPVAGPRPTDLSLNSGEINVDLNANQTHPSLSPNSSKDGADPTLAALTKTFQKINIKLKTASTDINVKLNPNKTSDASTDTVCSPTEDVEIPDCSASATTSSTPIVGLEKAKYITPQANSTENRTITNQEVDMDFQNEGESLETNLNRKIDKLRKILDETKDSRHINKTQVTQICIAAVALDEILTSYPPYLTKLHANKGSSPCIGYNERCVYVEEYLKCKQTIKEFSKILQQLKERQQEIESGLLESNPNSDETNTCVENEEHTTRPPCPLPDPNPEKTAVKKVHDDHFKSNIEPRLKREHLTRLERKNCNYLLYPRVCSWCDESHPFDTSEWSERRVKELRLMAFVKEEVEKMEAEKMEAEKIEAEEIEAEKMEAEKIEAEEIELGKMESEKMEPEKMESEKMESDVEFPHLSKHLEDCKQNNENHSEVSEDVKKSVSEEGEAETAAVNNENLEEEEDKKMSSHDTSETETYHSSDDVMESADDLHDATQPPEPKINESDNSDATQGSSTCKHVHSCKKIAVTESVHICAYCECEELEHTATITPDFCKDNRNQTTCKVASSRSPCPKRKKSHEPSVNKVGKEKKDLRQKNYPTNKSNENGGKNKASNTPKLADILDIHLVHDGAKENRYIKKSWFHQPQLENPEISEDEFEEEVKTLPTNPIYPEDWEKIFYDSFAPQLEQNNIKTKKSSWTESETQYKLSKPDF